MAVIRARAGKRLAPQCAGGDVGGWRAPTRAPGTCGAAPPHALCAPRCPYRPQRLKILYAINVAVPLPLGLTHILAPAAASKWAWLGHTVPHPLLYPLIGSLWAAVGIVSLLGLLSDDPFKFRQAQRGALQRQAAAAAAARRAARGSVGAPAPAVAHPPAYALPGLGAQPPALSPPLPQWHHANPGCIQGEPMGYPS